LPIHIKTGENSGLVVSEHFYTKGDILDLIHLLNFTLRAKRGDWVTYETGRIRFCELV